MSPHLLCKFWVSSMPIRTAHMRQHRCRRRPREGKRRGCWARYLRLSAWTSNSDHLKIAALGAATRGVGRDSCHAGVKISDPTHIWKIMSLSASLGCVKHLASHILGRFSAVVETGAITCTNLMPRCGTAPGVTSEPAGQGLRSSDLPAPQVRTWEFMLASRPLQKGSRNGPFARRVSRRAVQQVPLVGSQA
jgi:hypothetical protein